MEQFGNRVLDGNDAEGHRRGVVHSAGRGDRRRGHVEGALEQEKVTLKLGLTFIEVEKGEVKLLTLKPGVEFPYKKPVELPKYGIKGTLEVKTSLTLNVEPDLIKIAKWLAEQFGHS